MLPVFAIVGRPNVGKSSLFNCLTRSRDALVSDFPGLTRDRQYGRGVVGDRPFVIVDTGGLSGVAEGIDALMAKQVQAAIAESDVLIFVLDGREGVNVADIEIAQQLRQLRKPVLIVVNKTDGLNDEVAMADFYSLGFAHLLSISATNNQGIGSLVDEAFALLPEQNPEEAQDEQDEPGRIKVAVIGRPNVGKSTLINRMLGEERLVTYDLPGTTRDSIFIPFERDGQRYTLIDTAGVRRRGKVTDMIEKFSVIKSLKSIEACHLVVLVLTAQEEIAEQDKTILSYVLNSGKGLVIAVNKWDGLEADQRDEIRRQLDRKLSFLDFADRHFISALHGTGVGLLFKSIREAYKSAMIELNTSQLTALLETAVEAHQPPLVHGRRIKLRFAHPGGNNPPMIVIHGNQTESVPESYRRYLVNYFREALHLRGTSVQLIFKTGDNPFKGRKNELTQHQANQRKRMMRHVKDSRK